MKKIWIVLVMWLGLAGMAQAAMVCVEDGAARVKGSLPGSWHFEMICTFDATPGTATDEFPTTAPAGQRWSMMEIINQGLFVYNMSVIPGATGPTDNSDLEVKDSNGVILISAAGNGLDVIDETTTTSQIMGDGQNSDKFLKGNGLVWTITVTNNAVNSSSIRVPFDTTGP